MFFLSTACARGKHGPVGQRIGLLLVLCLLLAQLHASAHLHAVSSPSSYGQPGPMGSHGTAGLDCHCCAAAVAPAVAGTPVLQAPAASARLEALPKPMVRLQTDAQRTPSRAPPRV